MPHANDLLWERLRLIPGMEAAREHSAQRRVLVVGADALGAAVAVHLAGCHIRHLTLVDGDTVSESQLRHSLVFHPRSVGRPKVEVVRQALRAKFRGIDIAVEYQCIERCAPALFQAHDLIVCTSDNQQTRRWVNSWVVKWGKPTLFVGVGSPQMNWVGYVFLYQPGVSACFVCFDTGGEASDADEGASIKQEPQQNGEEHRRKYGSIHGPAPLLAPIVGAVASYAAALALKRLANVAPTPSYTLLDVKQPRPFAQDISPIPSCSVCGRSTS